MSEIDTNKMMENALQETMPAANVLIDDSNNEKKLNQGVLEIEYSLEEEKKLVMKLDLRVVSLVSGLYLLSFLDRGNIGNANTAGMSKDLGMSDSQYQWLLTIFYISYITFEWMTLLLKVVNIRYYMPTVVICWGICSSLCGVVNNWSSLMALRFLLGVYEAAYGPSIIYYLTFFYLRKEMAMRVGIFMSVTPLASAFSGILAYGITMHELEIESWRVLFLVEGLPTIAVGACDVIY